MTDESSVTDHHDGYGLNELCVIEQDEPGPGGASHHYKFLRLLTGEEGDRFAENFRDEPHPRAFNSGFVQFQSGPRGHRDSTPGIVEAALIAVVIDRLHAFQAGPFACRENALALTKCEEAMHWLKHRADARAKRGVLGTLKT